MARLTFLSHNPLQAIGIYTAYTDGKQYQLIGEALAIDSKIKVAVYRALFIPFQMFTCPWESFFEIVSNNEPRFKPFKA